MLNTKYNIPVNIPSDASEKQLKDAFLEALETTNMLGFTIIALAPLLSYIN